MFRNHLKSASAISQDEGARAPASSCRPRIRWWPAVLVITTAGVLLVLNALREVGQTQERVVFALRLLAMTVVLLLLWTFFFSRLRGRTRLLILALLVVVVGTRKLLFRLEGVSGDAVPILALRWSGEPDFGGISDRAGVINPGPHDYPQFYGPQRNASLPGPRLARDWNAQPPREVWRHDVGQGWSSFAVVGDAAVTQELRGQNEMVVRYELATGRQVWAHLDPEPFVTTVGGSGPRATPAIALGRVYTLGATGVLNCLTLDDGKLNWSRNVLEDNGVGIPDYGMSSSPLVVGEYVIVQLGRLGKSLVAYDLATGDPAWRAGEDNGSYSSPIFATLAGVEQVVILNQRSIAGHHPRTGERLWRKGWNAPGERISMPLILGQDRLLVSAGYGVGSRLLRLVPGDSGLAVEELWRSPRLKSKFGSLVVHRGTVFGLDDGVLTAIDPETGDRLWKGGRYGHGQLILVGDLLLIQSEQGDVVLVEATPEKHRELARLPALDGKTWNAPVLAGQYLLVRNHRQAACYELSIEG